MLPIEKQKKQNPLHWLNEGVFVIFCGQFSRLLLVSFRWIGRILVDAWGLDANYQKTPPKKERGNPRLLPRSQVLPGNAIFRFYLKNNIWLYQTCHVKLLTTYACKACIVKLWVFVRLIFINFRALLDREGAWGIFYIVSSEEPNIFKLGRA